MAVVFLTGLAVMVLELLAGRLTAPFFGQSTLTWAVLTGVTLAGVTAGNALGGYLANRTGRPWRVAALALTAAGLWVALLPLGLSQLVLGGGGFVLRLVVFATAAWLAPTLFVGCVSPCVAAALVEARGNGRALGRLYLASMAGSMLGSVMGGLWLPFALPADTLYSLLGTGLLALGAALALRYSRARLARAATPVRSASWLLTRKFALNAAVVFAIGWIGMAVELAGARLVTPVLGGNHIVWSAIFIAFIGWMGLGGWLGGRLADRWPGRRLPLAAAWLLALSILLTAVVQTRCFSGAAVGWHVIVRIAVQIFLGFAPVAALCGLVTTVVLKHATEEALVGGDKSVVGILYAISSVGSVGGTFVTGLICIGRVPSYSLCAALSLAVALGVALAVQGRRRESALAKAAFASAVALASVALLETIGAIRLASRPLPLEIRVNSDNRVLFAQESPYNVVTVTQSARNERLRTIWLDRVPHTTVDLGAPTNLLATYTRMLQVSIDELRRGSAASSVFMIGGGGYALPSAWLQSPEEWSRIVVAEIDPVVREAAMKLLGADQPGVETDERSTAARTWFPAMDGRRVAEMLLNDGSAHAFDFVVGDTISDSAIPYHLVTREFAERVKGLLKPEGVYLVHVLDRLDAPGVLSSVVRTLGETFREIEVVGYTALTDVRQSYVVLAADAKLPVRRIVESLGERYPDSTAVGLGADELGRLRQAEGALVYTDRFAPIDLHVWQVVAHDVQYRPYKMAERAMARWQAGQREEALALALEVLDVQHEQVQAMELLGKGVEWGLRSEDCLRVLSREAARPSAQCEAKIIYAQALLAAERPAQAADTWAALRRKWPDNADYTLAWLDARVRAGEGEAVLRWIDEHKGQLPPRERKAFRDRCQKRGDE